jgi:hypothetical protein
MWAFFAAVWWSGQYSCDRRGPESRQRAFVVILTLVVTGAFVVVVLTEVVTGILVVTTPDGQMKAFSILKYEDE